VKYTSYLYSSSRAEISAFTVEDGVTEYHVMIHATNPKQGYREQMNAVLGTYAVLQRDELPGAVAVFKRYFLSDASNQMELLLASMEEDSGCALSVVEQSPLDGTKIVLWVYLQTDMHIKALSDRLYEVAHGTYRQFWTGGNVNYAANSEIQMRLLLNDYITQLTKQGCKLADNCLRTWIFVQNVDCNYAGIVKARNEVFITQNLTEKTHYIASTGIGGRHGNPKVSVILDAYAVDGLQPGQIKYLHARTHLNPTYEYGVSFERGTAVDYGDRRQVFISGTASINKRGEVMYAGDVCRQTERVWENVEALLREADCCFEDMGYIIVYLRDVADYVVVREMFDKRFPDTPRVITLAPVCREQWLIEMECMAVKKVSNALYPSF
jgi:enamine deaminase RidA (YjgF/YER057c/UK114 family)